VSHLNPTTQKIYHASVNACLAPLVSVDGKHVITVEGIGNVKRPHPAQERVAKGNGSQCGFCTPGIVMSLYALLRNSEGKDLTEEEVEEAFDGNLCRCTGYKPILDAARTFVGETNKKTLKGCGRAGGCCMEEKMSEPAAGGCCKSDGPKTGGGCCMESKPKTSSGCCMGNGEKPAGGCCMDKLKVDGDRDIKKFTPPGFIEYNPDTELIFPPALKKHEFRPLMFGNKRKKWFRPVTLDQLLEIKAAYPDAKVIGGSTETQIEIKFKALQYPVSVYVGDIAELRQYKFHDSHLEIGANISLTDLEHICLDAVKHYGEAKSQVFKAIYKQLKYFAGRQIRNVGTPAGNLVTASPISDLNPVLMAAEAVLVAKTLDETTEISMANWFKGYRRTALPQNAVLASIRIPVTREKGEFIRSYKQSKRKDDDIAIVTGALRVRIDDDGVIEDVNLVYGGMAPTTVSAKQTNEFLKGKRFAELETLEGAMNSLGREFDLPYGVPGGMATYRKSLALGFFYRFYHEVMQALHPEAADMEAVPEIERQIARGREDREAAVEYMQETLGRSNPHVAALKQTTGEAQYTDDIPPLKNELYGCLVLSTKAHAKLKSVDWSAALEVPGVVDYVDHKDMPSPRANRWAAPHFDEVFLAEDEVYTAGQPIGLILATSPQRAAEGARAVKIEYEELPAVFTIEEAIEAGSFFDFYREIKRGDVEEAFKNCDYVFTGTARMGGQEHFYLETQAAVAIPKPEDGEMEIWSSTQNPSEA